MRWPKDARGWPMVDLSRIVLHRPHRWHVQAGSSGPTLLLIHGAGGATQSWRGLMPAADADTSRGRCRSARPRVRGTGSQIDDAGIALYLRLASDRGHVDATLTMTSQWNLDGLLARLPQIARPVTLIVGGKDGAVPPKTSQDAATVLPDCKVLSLPGLGHLAHEENPAQGAALILETLQKS